MTKQFFFTLVLGILLSVFNFDHSYAQAKYQIGVGMVQASPMKYIAPAIKSNFDRKTIERCQRDIYHRRNERCDRLYLTTLMEWPA
ncbi:MAG: hypothetical protein IKY11_01990, partial [Rikenellaceae bacterium]|nr:hypothetical protein [Rikenellaceae bacterium]